LIGWILALKGARSFPPLPCVSVSKVQLGSMPIKTASVKPQGI
jgi:hypothetical protein